MSRRKIDKIFNNSFDEHDYNPFPISFSESGDSDEQEDVIHNQLLLEEIHGLIINSEFQQLNQPDENGDMPSINKLQTNRIYSYVMNNLSGSYRKIEVWATLSDYFDIKPTKFYSNLSNSYKHELIAELEKTEVYQNKNKTNKLF